MPVGLVQSSLRTNILENVKNISPNYGLNSRDINNSTLFSKEYIDSQEKKNYFYNQNYISALNNPKSQSGQRIYLKDVLYFFSYSVTSFS